MPRRARERLVTTPWGERWLATVERAAGRGRLSRGLTYARSGRVDELAVEPGRIAAVVQGSRPTPYRVDVRLPAFDDARWARVIGRMGAGAATTAALVSGVLPETAEAAFSADGVSLFPGPTERVAAACTCPDWERPCKHAAAVCYAFGFRLDRDPLALFALRGRGREELLAELRAARRRAAPPDGDDAPEAAAGPAHDLTEELMPALGRFWSLGPRAAASAVETTVAPPDDPTGEGLRRLGLPPRALGGVELKMELALAYRMLGERARKVLAGER
jgi:uncharacterized Zn finger protein